MFHNVPEWLQYVGPVSMIAAVASVFLLVKISKRKAREKTWSIKGRPVSEPLL